MSIGAHTPASTPETTLTAGTGQKREMRRARAKRGMTEQKPLVKPRVLSALPQRERQARLASRVKPRPSTLGRTAETIKTIGLARISATTLRGTVSSHKPRLMLPASGKTFQILTLRSSTLIVKKTAMSIGALMHVSTPETTATIGTSIRKERKLVRASSGMVKQKPPHQTMTPLMMRTRRLLMSGLLLKA